ncbi:MAG: DoxX family membrane protein [Chloroflexota bacterium]|nr:MAG: DoxX family membrane protein [Chloroflexota bacterium]
MATNPSDRRGDRFAESAVDGDVRDPPIARAIFRDTTRAWLWLPVRLYVGIMWMQLGFRQLADSAWMRGDDILAYWRAVVAAVDRNDVGFSWYRSLVWLLVDANAEQVAARLFVFGELAAGALVILGAFVGLSAFGGALMNSSASLTGIAGSGPEMLALALCLMLGWRVAGFVGLDRVLLPTLGAAWVTTPGARLPPR